MLHMFILGILQLSRCYCFSSSFGMMRSVDALLFLRKYHNGHGGGCRFRSFLLPTAKRTPGATTAPTTRATTTGRFFSQSTTENNKKENNETKGTRSPILLLYDTFLQDVAPTAWRSIGLYNENMDLFENDPPMDDLFRSVMKEYADGVSREMEFQSMMNSFVAKSSKASSWNVSVLLRGYERHRQTSSGVIPTLLWGHFFTKPPGEIAPNRVELFQDGDFRRFLRLASLIAGIDNDILSHQKDDSWDYITICNKFGNNTSINITDNNTNSNTTLEPAVEQACQRHHELVQEWNILGKQLLAKYAEDIQPWINPICPTQWKAFVAWQSQVQRYKVTRQSTKEEEESSPDTSVQSLWQRLFGNDNSFQKYMHDIPVAQKELLEDIRADTLQWARACGLVGKTEEDEPTICSEAKLAAIDPALITILLFHYHRCGESDQKILKTFSRFFTFLVIYDDILEHPECHATAKEILIDLLYP